MIYTCNMERVGMPAQNVSTSNVPDDALPQGRTEVCIVRDTTGDRVIWYAQNTFRAVVFEKLQHILVLSQNTGGTLVNGLIVPDLAVVEVGIAL